MPSRKLEIELIGDNDSLSRAFRGAVRDSDTFGSRLRHAGVTGAKVLGGTLVAAAGAAAVGIVKSTAAAEESNKVHAQSGAVLESTGHAANVTQKGVEDLAGAISRKTGIDDEQIQSGENVLLTFTQIRNEAGKGNDIFDQATQTIVDMSTALGSDFQSSAIQVGKALNDPIKGITALQKAGVSFSEQKKEQITQWVEEGEVLRAQKAILKELGTEFGGSAAAQATAMDKIKVGVGNVEESIGNVFLPLVDEAATSLNRDLVPELQHTADGLARIAARKNIDMGEKLSLGGDVITRDWGDVPEQIGDLVDEAVPIVAERSGQLGVAAAEGMLHGFVHADPLGKAAILLFASKAFGGPAAVMGAGKQFGSRFGGAAATESALAMSTFGLGAGGTKAFGLIDKAKGVGKTVGRAGLAVGVISGLAAGLEGADTPSQHLQNALSAASFGLVPEGDGSWGNQIADGLIEDWDERLPEIEEHMRSRTLKGLGKDRDELVWTWKVAVATGASEERIDALRGKIVQLDQTMQGMKNAGKTLEQGIAGLEGGKFTRLGDIQQIVSKDAEAIAKRWGEGTEKAREATARNLNAAAHAVEIGMDRSVVKTKVGMAEIQRYTRNAHLVSGDDPWGIAKGFQRSWEKSGTITRQSLGRITQDLDKMPPAAAQVTAQMMIGMARQMRSKGQLSKNEVEKLRSAVVTKLDLMARQGGKKGEALELNVGGAFGGLSITTAEALENIGANVSQVMKALGAGQIPKFTLDYLQANAGGSGKKYLDQVPELNKARGGPVRVPGSGLQDTVPLAVNNTLAARVAPGEDLAVFNRHQRPLIDEAVAWRYGVNGLDGFFNTFDTPHYMAKGGLHEPRLSGPDPLRALGQAGIHKGYKAAQAYLKAHRPKPTTTGGVGGYTGPPANMKQLGDNAWVDSHTLAVAAYLSKQFGVGISSSYRDPQHNAEVGGVANSFHTHGSPSNPGAIDFTPPSSAALSFAQKHIAGLQEAMIHDVGSGLHLHLAFFNKGGKIGRFAGGGVINWDGLVGESWDNDELATLAHIVGMKNPGYMAQVAQGESSGDANAVGHDPGGTEGLGLWQVTTSFNDALIAKYGGRDAMFDPLLNAKAAKEILDEQGTGAWYAPATGERGEVDKALASKIRGAIAGEDPESSGPASKSQKHTLGTLRHKAAGVVREAQKLKAEYKKFGGTKTGKRALARTLKFAKQAAAKAKAGDRDAAKDLIGKARDSIGKSRDSLEKASEGVFTPGLKPGALPELGTTTYDPTQEFSLANLPGLGVLPPELQKILKAPGLDWAGKYGALETTLSMAGMTDTKVDDAAALNAMLGMDRRKRGHLKKQLNDLNKQLGNGGLTKKQRATVVAKRDKVMQGLGEVTSHIGSIRDQVGGLNEGEDPALKAAEETKQAAEEMKAAADQLKEEMEKTRYVAESELSVGLVEARRAIADLVSGELGPRVFHQAQTAGAGTVGTL